MNWFSLAVAIVFGVLGTLSMKLSHGFQHLKPALCVVLFYVISFAALTIAMQYIQLSIVYAIWSGVGTILMAIIGIVHFNESLSFRKFFYLCLIIIGIIGIHFSDTFIAN